MRYNLPILEITETVRTTNATTSAPEVLRGLGYWFFYGGDTEGLWLARPLVAVPDARGCCSSSASPSRSSPWPRARVLRWRHRAYFALLVGVGTLLAVGAFPIRDPSPAGDGLRAA